MRLQTWQVDQIFTLRQILKKTNEKQVDTHHSFVDYKAAFDSLIRDRVLAAMSELGIPAKLIRLCRIRPLIMRPLQLRHGEGAYRSGTIFQKSVQLLAYPDDIDNIGRTKRDVTVAFRAIGTGVY